MPPAQEFRHRSAPLILAGFCLLTTYSYLRGQRNDPEWAGIVYYVIDYSNGLIRRALIGQGFMAFFTRAQADQVWAAALVVHRAVAMLMMAGILLWFWSLLWQRRLFGPARFGMIYLLFVAGQFLPTVAAINTYLDTYVFLLIAAAFWLTAKRHYAVAACVGALVPLIHEMGVILWFSLVIMIVWRDGMRVLAQPWVAALCAAPVLSQLLLMAIESPESVQRQLARAPIPPAIRTVMAEQQLGHRVGAEIASMLALFAAHPLRALVSIVMFSLPACMMLGVAGGALHRRDRFMLCTCAAVPLGILLVGYDLSRFVVITQLTAMLGILFMTASRDAGSAAPEPAQDAMTNSASFRMAGAAACVMLLLPLIYAYFDQTHFITNEVLDGLPWLGVRLRGLYGVCDRLVA